MFSQLHFISAKKNLAKVNSEAGLEILCGIEAFITSTFHSLGYPAQLLANLLSIKTMKTSLPETVKVDVGRCSFTDDFFYDFFCSFMIGGWHINPSPQEFTPRTAYEQKNKQPLGGFGYGKVHPDFFKIYDQTTRLRTLLDNNFCFYISAVIEQGMEKEIKTSVPDTVIKEFKPKK